MVTTLIPTDTARTRLIPGTLTALSPIVHHGDEKTGSTPTLRAIDYYVAEEDALVRLPILSGNAVRGMLRRLVMHDFVARIGYTLTQPKLFHALFTGGVLESTDDSAGSLDLPFRRFVRDALPPVALFGTALGNQMLASPLKVEMPLPLCRETRATVIALRPDLADDPRLARGVREFTTVPFATRRDDLRAEREKDDQAQQMLVQFEAFVPGTRFLHGFSLAYASELEASCLGQALALWAETPIVGGKSGSGYGRVALDYPTAPDPAPYRDYCDQRAGELRAALDQTMARLAAKAPKQAKLMVAGDESSE